MVTIKQLRTSIKDAPIWIAIASLVTSIVLGRQLVIAAENVAKDRMEFAQTNLDLARLDAIVSDSQAEEDTIDFVLRTMPRNHYEVAAMVASIESTARAQAVSLALRIDDEATKELGGAQSITLTMQMSGSYTSMRTFLSSIAHLPYHTRIESITLDSAGGSVAGVVAMKVYIAPL